MIDALQPLMPAIKDTLNDDGRDGGAALELRYKAVRTLHAMGAQAGAVAVGALLKVPHVSTHEQTNKSIIVD